MSHASIASSRLDHNDNNNGRGNDKDRSISEGPDDDQQSDDGSATTTSRKTKGDDNSSHASNKLDMGEQILGPEEIRPTDNKSAAIAKLFDPKLLEGLRQQFKDDHRTGAKHLTIAEFVDLLSGYVPLDVCHFMYQRIDVNDDGYIEFSEFINYLIASETSITSEATNSNSQVITKVVLSKIQDPRSLLNHKEMVDHMCFNTKPCPMCITAARDGKINIWNPHTLEKLAQIKHIDKNSFYREKMISELTPVAKAQLMSHSVPTPDSLVTDQYAYSHHMI